MTGDFVVVAVAAIDELQIIDGDEALPIGPKHRLQLHLEVTMMTDGDLNQFPRLACGNSDVEKYVS